MKKIIEIMGAMSGCQFGNITYIADGGIPKKVIKGEVTKVVKTPCQFNYSYENAVNNRLEKQGSDRVFTALSLPWGNWVDGFENKLIEHKGNLYLRYYEVANAKPQVTWYVDGRLADVEEVFAITEYLVGKISKSSSNRQANVGLTENQVKPKVVKMNGILRLSVNGQEWRKQKTEQTAYATR